MIRNYLKIAFRNFKRNKGYSAINIIGLSLGMAASILILLFILDELSYDTFFPNSERIYRVNVTGVLNENEIAIATSPAPLAEALKEEVPQVEDAVRFGLLRTFPLTFEENAFTEPIVLSVDPNFLEFFGYQMLQGNPKTALTGPNKIVLTSSTARKYFGESDPIGKMILTGSEKTQMEVTGVVQDPPRNSHIDFDALLSGEGWWFYEYTNWTSNNIFTYFRISEGADLSSVNTALARFIEKNVGEEILQFLGVSLEAFYEQGNSYNFQVTPLLDIYLHSDLTDELKPLGNFQYLYIFGAVALFIILIACINFMNLSTARSARRAKEVGVRKSIGAQRSRLIWQFLSESIGFSLISGLIALLLILLALRPFNELSGKDLSLQFFVQPGFILLIFVFMVFVGILAGSYPAFYLTSFSPVEVLKGKLRAGLKRSKLRSGLVVFQFFVSISLIISSMVVYKQLKYMQEKDLGFDKENVIALRHVRSLGGNAEAFKQEVLAQAGFVNASFSNALPPKLDWSSVVRSKDKEQDILANITTVDEDHLETLGLEMASGRFFSKDIPSDTGAIIVNETIFKQMGWDKVDGTQEIMGFWEENSSYKKLIGVLKDYNYESLKHNVKPLVMLLETAENQNELAIRIGPGDVSDKLETLEGIWKKNSNGAAFEYSFLDADFNQLFQKEEKMGNIILVFTILAIFIACLGLFGLAAYTTEQRSKEISIRKALGASVPNLLGILSKDFTILVLLAFVLAGPVSYFLLTDFWLKNFAYRVDIDLIMIALAGFISLVIAMLTISYQSFKAATLNPVDQLKNE